MPAACVAKYETNIYLLFTEFLSWVFILWHYLYPTFIKCWPPGNRPSFSQFFAGKLFDDFDPFLCEKKLYMEHINICTFCVGVCHLLGEIWPTKWQGLYPYRIAKTFCRPYKNVKETTLPLPTFHLELDASFSFIISCSDQAFLHFLAARLHRNEKKTESK